MILKGISREICCFHNVVICVRAYKNSVLCMLCYRRELYQDLGSHNTCMGPWGGAVAPVPLLFPMFPFWGAM